MSFFSSKDIPARMFQFAAFLHGFAVLGVLTVYAYGGWFSRFLADDYCESAYITASGNLWDATLLAYNTWLNSYSILLFVQVSDWFGLWGFQLMTGTMLVFWLASLIWLVVEIGQALGVRFSLITAAWLAGLPIFLSLYQAPALYQILYWRTGLIPYSLPLVFFAGIAAFVLWYARQPYQKMRAVWTGVVLFVLVFFSSGLGETTSALQIGALASAVFAVWWTLREHGRKDILVILGLALAGAVISITIIALSPGTSTRLDVIATTKTPVYNPILLARDVSVYTVLFLWDAFKVAPLPNLFSLVVPFGVMYFCVSSEGDGAKISSARITRAAVVLLVFMFFVIGCSFAPSAFAQGFPVARARYAAHFILTLSLILEGGLLGMLAGRMRIKISAPVVRSTVALLLALLAIYPLYASTKVYAATAEYRRFASAWDVRDAQIRQAIAEGATDLVVVQLDSIGGVGEYKGNRIHWINVCAAQYYGLDSLIAP